MGQLTSNVMLVISVFIFASPMVKGQDGPTWSRYNSQNIPSRQATFTQPDGPIWPWAGSNNQWAGFGNGFGGRQPFLNYQPPDSTNPWEGITGGWGGRFPTTNWNADQGGTRGGFPGTIGTRPGFGTNNNNNNNYPGQDQGFFLYNDHNGNFAYNYQTPGARVHFSQGAASAGQRRTGRSNAYHGDMKDPWMYNHAQFGTKGHGYMTNKQW